MADRAFPVIFAERVGATSGFYERLGFERHFQLPPDGEPGYVGLRRGGYELAVVSTEWPRDNYGRGPGPGVRFEMFVYVDDVDAAVDRARAAGSEVLREPADMPWGERVGYVTDPEGNPVALASTAKPGSEGAV